MLDPNQRKISDQGLSLSIFFREMFFPVLAPSSPCGCWMRLDLRQESYSLRIAVFVVYSAPLFLPTLACSPFDLRHRLVGLLPSSLFVGAPVDFSRFCSRFCYALAPHDRRTSVFTRSLSKLRRSHFAPPVPPFFLVKPSPKRNEVSWFADGHLRFFFPCRHPPSSALPASHCFWPITRGSFFPGTSFERSFFHWILVDPAVAHRCCTCGLPPFVFSFFPSSPKSKAQRTSLVPLCTLSEEGELHFSCPWLLSK